MKKLDELNMQHDVVNEQEFTSCSFTLKKEVFIVIDSRLSQSEKLEDVARLLNKI
ncbi:hypothetical protein BLH47_06415 [Listeria monocytogenes]|uniref:hypothetical protein n=1 Tax=Listeria monocytogenes TaxID=1639 RepID=UPI0010DFF304|nr:hypothetical protein [Listeria monocytogenes]EAE2381300.1 hypothetical protein [Listeria monocytogenes]EAG4713327.1 hypothetical protein [Listeria monocytogenes]EAG7433636.1 hypothetical protein [Listeria monocytogenes]EGI5122119.1 hypothetical protein [Listeria monocytogenes]HAB7843147.1 hypothetical protein [Listeria monocytogenes]